MNVVHGPKSPRIPHPSQGLAPLCRQFRDTNVTNFTGESGGLITTSFMGCAVLHLISHTAIAPHFKDYTPYLSESHVKLSSQNSVQ